MIETPNNAQNGRANVINWRFHIDIPINAIMMATISMEDGNLASVSVNALRMVLPDTVLISRGQCKCINPDCKYQQFQCCKDRS